MPIEKPEIAFAREAATEKLATEYATARGRTPTAQDRLHVFRDRVQAMSHYDLLVLLGEDWNPQGSTSNGPRERGATEADVVAWLQEHRPNITATERLREVRRMIGKPLPELGVVSAAEHSEQREARKREHMRAHLAERAEYMRQFKDRG